MIVGFVAFLISLSLVGSAKHRHFTRDRICEQTPLNASEIDRRHMQRALELARRGEGYVEPNPQVGCVVAMAEKNIAEGWHRRFGDAHAEVDAIRKIPVNHDLAAATLYVTLEPCCHTGKTPPCTDAILKAGIGRVVVAVEDPFPQVAGHGLERLRRAGVQVETGVGYQEGQQLLAPYLKLQRTGRPWVIAKWAMTLDGKLATSCGDSQWISSPASRKIVHQLRGRVDGVLVGSQTAVTDNPQLTARPPGPRTAHRIVLDSQACLATRLPDCNLARTADETPVLLFVASEALPDRISQLQACGIEVVRLPGESHHERIGELLRELGRREMTNVLVEGGAGLFGLLLDANEIDEVHAFIAPKLIGGATASSAVHGKGLPAMADALQLVDVTVEQVDHDTYVHGRVSK